MKELQLHGDLFAADIQSIEAIYQKTLESFDRIQAISGDVDFVLGVGKEGIAEVYYAAVVQLQKRYVHFLFTRSSSQKTADFETHIASIADTATTNINEGLAKFSRSAYVAIINETWPKMYEQFFNVSWLLR